MMKSLTENLFNIRVKIIQALERIEYQTEVLINYRNKLISRNSISLSYNIFGSKLTPKAEYEFFYVATQILDFLRVYQNSQQQR